MRSQLAMRDIGDPVLDRSPAATLAGAPGSTDIDGVIEGVRTALGASWGVLIEGDSPATATLIGRSASAPDLDAIRASGWLNREQLGYAWIDPPRGDGAVLLLPVSDPEHGERRLLAAGFDGDTLERGRISVPMLAPILRTTLGSLARVFRRLEAERRLRTGMREALDHSHLGVLVFDRDGHLQFHNRAARAMLAERQGIRVSGNTVAPTALADAIRFQVTLEHMVERSRAAGGERGPAAQVMLLDRGSGKRPLVATLTQADQRASEPGDAAAILYLVKPEQDLTPLLASLCQLHKLSPAETRLVHELVGGHTLAEAAKTMHVSEHTARAYLKQAFQKTGTNRQTDLVRLMLMSLLPLPENIAAGA